MNSCTAENNLFGLNCFFSYFSDVLHDESNIVSFRVIAQMQDACCCWPVLHVDDPIVQT